MHSNARRASLAKKGALITGIGAVATLTLSLVPATASLAYDPTAYQYYYGYNNCTDAQPRPTIESTSPGQKEDEIGNGAGYLYADYNNGNLALFNSDQYGQRFANWGEVDSTVSIASGNRAWTCTDWEITML